MPRGDGTGPMGTGAMTGRGAGYCAGFGMPGYANSNGRTAFARGFGLARGFGGGGRGLRRCFNWMGFGAAAYRKSDPEMEKRGLKAEADALQSQLDLIRQRLTDIDSGAQGR